MTTDRDDAPDVTPLFRRAALDSATVRYGAPVQAPGVGIRLATAFFVVLIVAVGAFLFTVEFPRKETVAGSLVPSAGLLSVVSQRPGIVAHVYVEEGASVEAGDPIVRVVADEVASGGIRRSAELAGLSDLQSTSIEQRHSAAEAAIRNQKDALHTRIRALESQLGAIRQNVSLLKEQLTIAEETAGDMRRLSEQKLVSQLQLRDAEARVLAARQTLSEAHIRVAQVEHEQLQLRHEIRRLNAEHDLTRANRMSEQVAAREKALSHEISAAFELVAPRRGRITSLRAKPGAPITDGKPVAVLMPSGAVLLAEVWVPSSAIAFVNPGTKVRLMYDAFPYQKFGVARATVLKIASSPTPLEELPAELQAKESRYRVLAALERQQMDAYAKTFQLTPGLRFKADLILEERSLLDWLAEPLHAARRRQP